MSQMRSFIIYSVILLQVVLLLSGCYSYRSVTAGGLTRSYRGYLSQGQVTRIEIKKFNGLAAALILTPIAIYIVLKIIGPVSLIPTPGAGE